MISIFLIFSHFYVHADYLQYDQLKILDFVTGFGLTD